MRPFRFGAAVFAAETSKQWTELARQIEDLGYSTLLLPDHIVTPFAPGVALTAAADATSSLRVGTMVYDNDFRHPVMLAKEVATADVMTDGRFEVGIGAGWHVDEYRAAGIGFDPAATRVARLAEAVKVLKGLWAEGDFTFQGDYYTIESVDGSPKPVQKPHPPIMIGGGGRRTLELAAREADIVSFAAQVKPDGTADTASLKAGAFEQRLRWMREAAPDRFDSLELSNYYSTPAVIGDRETAIKEVLSRFEARWGSDHGVTEQDIVESPHFLFGSVEEMIETLQGRRERYGVSYIVFTNDPLQYAPIVKALAGT